MNAPNESDKIIKQKSKRFAVVTALAVLVLLLGSSMGAISYAGLGGTVMLFMFLIFSVIVFFLLYLILYLFYKIILNHKKSLILRGIFTALLLAGAIGVLYLAYGNSTAPYASVQEIVSEIPEMEEYFNKNKEELESQRLAGGNNDSFRVIYPEKSRGLVVVSFCFDKKGSQMTVYHKPYLYTYRLDDNWYIEIYLPPAI